MITKEQKINDRYRIVRLIGEGGMANVYLAFDEILGRNVAVKVLRGDLAEDEKFVRRFQREAINASSLSHPNIVEMYDVGEDDGNYFIVMEYVEGRTLKSLIKRRGALTLHETVDIMKQLTSAVIHAHSSYIIHRDIKPQNVLILDDGTLKITDFGIAMAMNSNEITQTNSVMGSVHYLPPEQANGGSATIRSDIYSLGILMYELLIGRIPFRGDNAVEIAIKQMREQLPSVRAINPDIPQTLENIILKACAKNPKNRYENANQLFSDLEKSLDPEFQTDERIVYEHPENESNVRIEEKPEKKKSDMFLNLIIGFLAFICISLVGGIIYLVLIYPSVSKTEEVVVPNVANMDPVEAEKALREVGLKVELEYEEEFSSNVPEGLVARTIPQQNRTVKEGTKIKLVISLGELGIVLEDYTGDNYYEIKAMLELRELVVFTDQIDVDDPENYEENKIIGQKPEAGTKVKPGDSVTLILPIIKIEYPDFTSGSWTISDIEEFTSKHGVTLNIEYRETTSYSEGAIISQSRPPESTVTRGVSLKIVVATAPYEEEEPEEYYE